MFKDLKEYQEITRIYHESVNISEEQRAINKAIAEAGFTDEEILYLDENFDELWETELETLTEEIIAEEQEQLDEMAAKVAKVAVKAAPKLAHTAAISQDFDLTRSDLTRFLAAIASCDHPEAARC